MTNEREIFELATEYASKLRAAGVLRFEGLGIMIELSPVEPELSPMARSNAQRELDDQDDRNDGITDGMSDPATYPGGYMPSLRRIESQ